MRKNSSLPIFIILSLFLYIFIPFRSAYAQAKSLWKRERAINDTLNRIELTVEYSFLTGGDQIFEVVDSQGRRISRLEYPHRGEMLMLKGEAGFPNSRFSIGGRFGSSSFRRKRSKDQDWLPSISGLVWLESEALTKPKIQFYDINLYYNLKTLSEEDIGFASLSSERRTIYEALSIDRLSADVFLGYLYHMGRYPIVEGVTTISNYVSTYSPLSGHNSFYKVRYRGPRVGLRLRGSSGKARTELNIAYTSWLDTDAFGWWNLREYAFWQSGSSGSGIDVGLELTYSLTPSLSIGLGYHYVYLKQEKLKEQGEYYDDPYSNYNDLDIIRNVNCKIYGPSVVVKYVW